MVLEASAYPDDFPQQFQFAYVPESKQAVVECELPTVGVSPVVKAYTYVRLPTRSRGPTGFRSARGWPISRGVWLSRRRGSDAARKIAAPGPR